MSERKENKVSLDKVFDELFIPRLSTEELDQELEEIGLNPKDIVDAGLKVVSKFQSNDVAEEFNTFRIAASKAPVIGKESEYKEPAKSLKNKNKIQ